MNSNLRIWLKVLSIEHPTRYNFLRTIFYLGLALLLCLFLESPIQHLGSFFQGEGKLKHIAGLLKSGSEEEKKLALRLLEEKAAQNDDQARLMLAQGWHDGSFGEKNYFRARKWLLQMAHPLTGQSRELKRNLDQAFGNNEFTFAQLEAEASLCDRIWTRSPGQTTPEELVLAMMRLQCGSGVQNTAGALAILEKLADNKNPVACYLLGKLFAEGKDVDKDLDLSASYLVEACAGNVEEACRMLAGQKRASGRQTDRPQVGRSLREIREQLEMLAK